MILQFFHVINKLKIGSLSIVEDSTATCRCCIICNLDFGGWLSHWQSYQISYFYNEHFQYCYLKIITSLRLRIDTAVMYEEFHVRKPLSTWLAFKKLFSFGRQEFDWIRPLRFLLPLQQVHQIDCHHLENIKLTLDKLMT